MRAILPGSGTAVSVMGTVAPGSKFFPPGEVSAMVVSPGTVRNCPLARLNLIGLLLFERKMLSVAT